MKPVLLRSERSEEWSEERWINILTALSSNRRLLFRGYLQEFRRGRILEREREISAPFDFHRGRGDERRRTTRSTTRLMERGNKERGVEIRWLEIVQADYTFSFVLKYGGSQRENNVSLITRFGSTRATPAPRCSVPFLHPPSSFALCPFVSLDLPSPSGSNASTPPYPFPSSGSTAETGIKMMFAWKPKALPTLSSEVRRITLPFIRPRFHNICSLNFQERQLHDFFSTFLFFFFIFFLVESPFLNDFSFFFFFVWFAFF